MWGRSGQRIMCTLIDIIELYIFKKLFTYANNMCERNGMKDMCAELYFIFVCGCYYV